MATSTDQAPAGIKVRWGGVAGMSEWIECQDVRLQGPWLIIDVSPEMDIIVPDHIVRGRVEVSYDRN